MNTEFAAMLEQPGFLADWARKVHYGLELSSDEKEMNAAADAYWKEVGRTGIDKDYELSALLTRALSPEVIMAPGELLTRMFDEGTVGEFDDVSHEVGAENTLRAEEAILGGNVDRSFIDHSLLTPTWKSLQIETDIMYQDLRRGGYKNVANLVNYAREAFEQKRVSLVMTAVSAAITSGAANYVTEATTAPTDTSMQALALYLGDMANGTAPFAFGLNKYMQTVANLTLTTTNKTDVEKSLWNHTGYVKEYAGLELIGYSGQKKLADGSYLVPDKTILGAAAKIGNMDMRGETRVFETFDNNAEKVHLKLNGYTFGYTITRILNAAKMVIA